MEKRLFFLTNLYQRFTLVVMLSFCVLPLGRAHSASLDGLTLRGLFDMVIDGSPVMRSSRLELRAAVEDVSSVERRRWPTVSTTVESYSGNARSLPARSFQVDQPVWDGGGISAQISEARAVEEIARFKYLSQQHELFLQTVSSWQSLLGSRERMAVAQEALMRLGQYQGQMRRRVDAEASPKIELDLADSRILQTEVELALARASMEVAALKLEQLTGHTGLLMRIDGMPSAPTLVETGGFNDELVRVDWLLVAVGAPSVNKARFEAVQLGHRLSAKQAEGWPQLYVRAYKPIGQGSYSSVDSATTYFAGLKYTPGAGFSTVAEAKAITTRLSGAQESADAALREMIQVLHNDRLDFISARARIAALEKSVSGSALVLDSYKRQFEAGRKTWQDLLNAVRELAQNQYALADARASMAGAMYRLKIRMGQEIE